MGLSKFGYEIYSAINKTDWHYFQYHFSAYHPRTKGHPLANSIIDSCEICESQMTGYSNAFMEKLCSFSGREKYIPHYDQILQLLAELLVISHLSAMVDESWTFTHEPVIEGSKKNPEIEIEKEDVKVLVEVKSPNFNEYQKIRSDAKVQIAGRYPHGFTVASALCSEEGNKALPRDNNVKDFLISADQKFSAFKVHDKSYLTVLVIAWDDFIYEPITALINTSSGLITENSYFKDQDGNPIKFDNINYIVILRNMTQIANATCDHPVTDGLSHPLDYGLDGQTLPKALIEVNSHPKVDFIKNLFQCQWIEDLQMAAEYRPQEVIMNFKF